MTSRLALRNGGIVLTVIAGMALSACEVQVKPLEKSSAGAIRVAPFPNPTSTVAPVQLSGKLGLSSASVSLGLATQQVLNLQITAADDFAGGQVNLSLDRGDLAAADSGNDVVVSLSPSSVMLNPGETQSFNVTVEAKSTSRSFSGAKFHVQAQASGDTAASDVSLTVNPVLEVRFNGGTAPESFSHATPLNVRAHAGGVTFRFINYDTARAHIVHSGGAIPHQNTGMPMMAPASAGAPGGTYEKVILPSAGKVSSTWWCHSHEASSNGKVVNFNTDI